jgi:hypothetical protein
MIKRDETGRQTKEELEEQTGEELPDREVMSIWPVLDPFRPLDASADDARRGSRGRSARVGHSSWVSPSVTVR